MAKRFGVMLDMSRNAVMKPEKVKEFASILKSFGYNMLQLYTEDTYEVDGEPYFGYLRGRYSKEEMKDIVKYCDSIGIELIPCMQTLAHLENIFKWREYTRIRDCGNIMLVGEERTYQLIDNMLATLRECVTTDVIHIGMDEAHMLGLGKYLDKHGYRNRFDILKEHLEIVIGLCKKHGFKPIMWSDMFFRLANGGEYYDWSNITDEVIAAKPDGVDLVYWDYYHNDKNFYDGMLAAHSRFKGETWFGGGIWTWGSYSPLNTWSMLSMKEAILACKDAGTDNIFMTMWGDDGRESSFYAVLPVLFALRKFYDGVTDEDDIKREFYEITGESFDAMMALELPNIVTGNRRESPSHIAKPYLFSDPLLGFLDVTVKPGLGKEFAENAKVLREYAKNSLNYGYIFENLANLCDILEIKYELGARTRAAYKAGDKAALALIMDDYVKCATRVKKFHRSFSIQWHKENKANGFEVQDSRFGGLVMRLEACIARIEAYLAGGVDTLEELDEELLPYDASFNGRHVINGTPGTAQFPNFDVAKLALTVNNF